MNININISLNTVEEKTLNWVVLRRRRIFVWLGVIIVIISIPSIPYLNLHMTASLGIFFMIVSTLTIFYVAFKKLVVVVSLLFLVALFMVILGEIERAEMVGEYIYGLLLTGIISDIVRSRDD